MQPEIDTAAEALEAEAIPRSGAVLTEPGAMTVAEQMPLPAAICDAPHSGKGAAQWAYERLILYIKNFEEGLDEAQEVAVGFTGGDAGILRIEGIGYFDPDIVTFYGTDEFGARTQLIQHVAQLSVILRALPRSGPDEAPRRIGFRLAEGLGAKK